MTLLNDFHFSGSIEGIFYRPLALSDEALVKNWIGSAEWQKDWDEPDKEWGYFEQDLKTGAAHVFIFEISGEPIGLVQYWHYGPNRQFAEEINEVYLRDFPDDAVGIDISIGKAQNLSKGLGSTVVRTLANALHEAGAMIITIDPSIKNARAIRAYEKAGFQHHQTYDDTYVMIWQR